MLTVLDAGPAPDGGACLRLLAEAEVGCWFDRRAGGGISLLMVDPDRVVRTARDALPALTALAGAAPPGPFGFAGGWAGWVSYEGALTALGLGPAAADAAVAHYPAALAIDHARGTAHAVGRGPAGDAAARAWVQRLRKLPGRPAPQAAGGLRLADPGPSRAAFVRQVREVQGWIAAGETYVVNLTYRIRLDGGGDPAAAYARLAALHPAPYAALLRDRHRWVLSSSPELLLRRRGGRVWTRPIKGTRPAGQGSGLAEDPKERAELTMIVDMARNDLGRVARPGSVRVSELFATERHPGLEHLLATVEAEAAGRAGVLLGALLPAGSVTGAPKRRAVERLAGLEADPRGVYTGTIGCCDDGGDMEWNVAIRTVQAFPGEWLYGTGGGITADSDPDAEYAETRLKARGPLRALGLAWE
jgi:anthranilate/para-aminobenzoate synthase component I